MAFRKPMHRWDTAYRSSAALQTDIAKSKSVFYLSDTYGFYKYLNNSNQLRRFMARKAHSIMQSIRLELPQNEAGDSRPQPHTQLSIGNISPGGYWSDRVAYGVMDNSERNAKGHSRIGFLNRQSMFDSRTQGRVASGKGGVPTRDSIVDRAITRAKG